MAISIEIHNSCEDEESCSSKCSSQLGAVLGHRNLRARNRLGPHPLRLLPLSERAAREVLRDLPSFGEQERSKSPLGLLYSRQVSSLPWDLLTEQKDGESCLQPKKTTKSYSFRSTSFTTEEIYNLFGGFCPISGSPVRPSAWSKWGSIPFKKASNTAQSTTGNDRNELVYFWWFW